MLTRIFQSGNSLAVRIPKELALGEAVQEVEIERVGNTLVIRPVEKKSLAGLGSLLAAFPSDFMAEGRGHHEQQERDWGDGAPSE
jgi:antitoxin VapB